MCLHPEYLSSPINTSLGMAAWRGEACDTSLGPMSIGSNSSSSTHAKRLLPLLGATWPSRPEGVAQTAHALAPPVNS
jgi:hypothetical protein